MNKEYFYCPKCKSSCIVAGNFDVFTYCRRIHCEDCHFEWIESFELMSNFTLEGEELGEPDEEL